MQSRYAWMICLFNLTSCVPCSIVQFSRYETERNRYLFVGQQPQQHQRREREREWDEKSAIKTWFQSFSMVFHSLYKTWIEYALCQRQFMAFTLHLDFDLKPTQTNTAQLYHLFNYWTALNALILSVILPEKLKTRAGLSVCVCERENSQQPVLIYRSLCN